MDNISLMISITNRDELSEIAAVFTQHDVSVLFVSLGRGTSPVAPVPKAVCHAVVTAESWKTVKADLEQKHQIDLPNRGIVFTIPMSSAGGMKALTMLAGDQKFEVGEESVLKDTKYELILAIANAGHSDEVMDAARSAGAKGGTVVHAKGSGRKGTEEFFGVTLATEKDLIYIVLLKELKNSVMKAIMDSCGLSTPAKTVVMSLPVTSTAGMRFYEMQELDKDTEEISRETAGNS